jgi:hypothetical protein
MTFSGAYDPRRAFEAGWELLKRAPGVVLVGGILLLLTESGPDLSLEYAQRHSSAEVALLTLVGGLAALAGLIAWAFGCLLRVGLPSAIEHSLKTGEDRVGLLFALDERWLWMLLTTLLEGAIYVVAALPVIGLGGAVALFGVGFDRPELGGLGLALIVLLWIPFMIYLALGLSLAPQAVALEGLNPIQAVRRSWTLVSGNRLWLILFGLVFGLVNIAGLCACGVGLLITVPLTYAASSEAYLRLVRSREEQGNWASAA